MTINMIKPGILAQWKKDKSHWGYHWKDDTNIGIKNHRIRLFDTEIYRDYVEESKKLILARNKEEKELENKNLSEKEHDKEIIDIFMKYSKEIKELELQKQIFTFQYCFLVLENKIREWKVGNTILKQQKFWKGMITRRDGNNQIIWLDEIDIEPYEEESYELNNHLLKKHRERINKKL
jgi:hypothetical protein